MWNMNEQFFVRSIYSFGLTIGKVNAVFELTDPISRSESTFTYSSERRSIISPITRL